MSHLHGGGSYGGCFSPLGSSTLPTGSQGSHEGYLCHGSSPGGPIAAHGSLLFPGSFQGGHVGKIIGHGGSLFHDSSSGGHGGSTAAPAGHSSFNCSQGVHGSNDGSHTSPQQGSFLTSEQPGPLPGQEATLPAAFNMVHLQDPTTGNWNMDRCVLSS
jgi:hypothetical protein